MIPVLQDFDSLIFWRSKKQSFASKSSVKSGYLSSSCRHHTRVNLATMITLRYGCNHPPTTSLYCNSKSAMEILYFYMYMYSVLICQLEVPDMSFQAFLVSYEFIS